MGFSAVKKVEIEGEVHDAEGSGEQQCPPVESQRRSTQTRDHGHAIQVDDQISVTVANGSRTSPESRWPLTALRLVGMDYNAARAEASGATSATS